MHGCLESIRRRRRGEIHILTGADGGKALYIFLVFLEMSHAVEGAADLEAEDLLSVLALEVDVVAKFFAENFRVKEVGLLDDLWKLFKYFIGFGDEFFVVGFVGRKHDLETRSG